ncbi:MAG: acyl-CoA thioesterase [Niveispirillum sp.]|uniref:acyl-CoA thioesterase n=1 Tax=Niveispirillum sp. TaxID=1917217 RepID=UPI003BA42D23
MEVTNAASGPDEGGAPGPTEMVERLVRLLTVTEMGPDLYQGCRQIGGRGRVFGGQVVAQALAAAIRSVDGGRIAHSLHAYFMRGGDEDYPIDLRVHRDFDGRSFATRRVEAIQGGEPILTLSASFQRPEEGLAHADYRMPAVPMPEDLPPESEVVKSFIDRLPAPSQAFLKRRRSVELRHVNRVDPTDGLPHDAVQHVWFRVVASMPDLPDLHRVALAYMSDMVLLGSSLLPHGINWMAGTAKGASLDHAVWFHEPDFRVDDWLLYSTHSPWTGGGRGLNQGRIFDRQGRLVASTAQEGVIRRMR